MLELGRSETHPEANQPIVGQWTGTIFEATAKGMNRRQDSDSVKAAVDELAFTDFDCRLLLLFLTGLTSNRLYQ